MNIKKEIQKLERKKQTENTIRKAFSIIKNLLCQHKECITEVIDVQLGNCTTSLLEEVLGEESQKLQQMKMRIIRCANCGRELYREYFDVDNQSVSTDKTN